MRAITGSSQYIYIFLFSFIAITFVFSTAGCFSEVELVEQTGLDMKSPEKKAINSNESADQYIPRDYENDLDQYFSYTNGLRSIHSYDDLLGALQALTVHQMQKQLLAIRDNGVWGHKDYDSDDDDDDDDDDSCSPGEDPEYSQTNVQEEGVDEPDMVKTDGQYLYIYNGGYFLIYGVIPQEITSETSRIALDGVAMGMFVYGDKAIAFSKLFRNELPNYVWPDIEKKDLYNTITKLTFIDHSNKRAPSIFREIYVEGDQIDSRRIGSIVRVFTKANKTGPEIDTYLSWRIYPSKSEYQYAVDTQERKNRKIIYNSPLEAWLPRTFEIVTNQGFPFTRSGYVSSFENHYLPNKPMGLSTVSVLHADFDYPNASLPNISLIADGQLLYGNQNAMYVADSLEIASSWDQTETHSQIHKFDLVGDWTQYVASGIVPGFVLNQFSMSEYEGYFRVATTLDWNTNGVYILEQENDTLNIVGRIDDIAAGEEVYAARFIGYRGFLVTYPRTTGMDPLFTLALEDPANPRLVGELEIPGFSTYLHPLDADHLIAIGEDGDLWGALGGVALAIYDISDFANPIRTHFMDLGHAGVSSEAKTEHHAFLYYSPMDLLAIPLWDYDNSSVLAFECTASNGFQLLSTVDHKNIAPENGSGHYYGQNIPRRTVVIGNYLFSISDCGLVVTRTTDWVDVVVDSLPWNP